MKSVDVGEGGGLRFGVLAEGSGAKGAKRDLGTRLMNTSCSNIYQSFVLFVDSNNKCSYLALMLCEVYSFVEAARSLTYRDRVSWAEPPRTHRDMLKRVCFRGREP